MNIEPSTRKLNYLLIVLTYFSRIPDHGAGKAEENEYIPLHCKHNVTSTMEKNFEQLILPPSVTITFLSITFFFVSRGATA